MKSLKNSENNYGSLAILFHWVMALAIITILVIGFKMTGMENSPSKGATYAFHKSLGISILALAVLRLIWRLNNITPKLPMNMKIWQKISAKISHFLLYFLMFSMPLSGWGMSSAAGYPVSFFGLFNLPALVAKNDVLKKFFAQSHQIMAFILVSLIIIHFTAALYHHFVRKDDVLKRMG